MSEKKSNYMIVNPEYKVVRLKPNYLIVKPEYKVVRARLLYLGLPCEDGLGALERVIHLEVEELEGEFCPLF